MKIKWNEAFAIFLVSAGTLLFQITLTKIYEFSLWGNYAYLVISTAMFGLGFSGVVLTRWPGLLKKKEHLFLPIITFLCGITLLTAFFGINTIPIHLPTAPEGLGVEIRNVAAVFLIVAIPYFFFGLLISYILDHKAQVAGFYYGADLIGAGVGCFLLMFLIPRWEPQGLVFFSFMLVMLATVMFIYQINGALLKKRLCMALFLFMAVISIPLADHAKNWVTLRLHVAKRNFRNEYNAGVLEKSGWSALSRVDIAPFMEGSKRVWINGGINESSIFQFDGDFERLRAGKEENIRHAQDIVHYQVYPYLIKTDPVVCMIGTSGGSDAMNAFRYGARKVVGVEMDPLICKFVTEDYKDFAGGLFTDGDYSEQVIDEGRSYLKRSDRKFDIIQIVNNYTPIAFHNGALNLSESYLMTVESFKDFYESLNDDGVLCINQHGAIRMLTTAIEMFKRMGIPREQYAQQIMVLRSPRLECWAFMMKKSPFTVEEVTTMRELLQGWPAQVVHLVCPPPGRAARYGWKRL